MTTLNEARMPSLKDKIEAQAQVEIEVKDSKKEGFIKKVVKKIKGKK